MANGKGDGYVQDPHFYIEMCLDMVMLYMWERAPL